MKQVKINYNNNNNILKVTNRHDCTQDDLDMAKKENLKKDNEFLLIAAQNNYIKAKINNRQQNTKYRLCGDTGETVNHIISECSKLAQKGYKTRHN